MPPKSYEVVFQLPAKRRPTKVENMPSENFIDQDAAQERELERKDLLSASAWHGHELTEVPGLITISIVSHGQAALVRKLLKNLNQIRPELIASIVVTLNIPEADMLADVNCNHPLQILLNKVPKGFGSNHNAAFAHCKSEWFLVLNPDIEIRGDPLLALALLAAPATGLLSPRIKEPGKLTPEPHRALLTPAEILMRRFNPPADTPAWVPGMFMLVRNAAFREINGFDEKYFMYVEDADLCARMQLAGWKIQIEESITVFHDAQRASKRRLRPMLWHGTSLLRWWTSVVFWRALIALKG